MIKGVRNRFLGYEGGSDLEMDEDTKGGCLGLRGNVCMMERGLVGEVGLSV